MAVVQPLGLCGQTLPSLPAGPTTTLSPVQTPETNYQGRTIEEVKIVGNSTVSAAVIRNLIRTRQGDPFDRANVEEDYHRIFELKKFANVVPRVEPTSTGVIVVFEVVEQSVITAIRVRGNNNVSTETLLDKIDIRVGQSIDSFRINLARLAIEHYYRDENYPFAHVDVIDEPLQRSGVLVYSIVEGPHVRIRNVTFEGNHTFSSGKLKDEIKTGSYFPIFRSGTLDEDQLEDDVAALQQYYRNHGFFDVRVGRKIAFSPDQSEAQVTFVINEGRRYTIAHIRFEGNQKPHTEFVLRGGMKCVEGQTYDFDLIQRDMRQIVKTYGPGYIYAQPGMEDREHAYLHIDPVEIFHKEAGQLDLVYKINEGGKFRIADIVVKGNSKVQAKVYLRELRLAPGEWYDSSTLVASIDRIRALRLVDNVTVTPIGDDPNFRTVLVNITESQTATFLIGAGFSSNYGVLGSISFEQRDFDITNVPSSWGELLSAHAFTGAGQYFKILLQPGFQFSQARIQFGEPYVFDQPYSFSTDLYYQTFIQENYDEIRTGGKFSVGKRFGDDFLASITIRAEEVEIAKVLNEAYRPLEILDAEGTHPLTGLGISFRYNTTDSPLLPTQGYILGLGYERVGALGGQYDFDKITAEASMYRLIYENLDGRKTTFNQRFTAGYETSSPPFFERFYGGGIGNILGFRWRGVGPRAGIEHDPIGGSFSVLSASEVNFPLIGETLRGVVFLDAGTVEKNVEITTIRSSIGCGFRLTLPFLGQVPLALNFAVPITKGRYDDTQYISFSLGLSQ